MKKLLALLGVACVAVFCSACSSNSDGAGPAKDCTADATRTCTCSGGATGSQVCSSAGFWKACTCGTCPVTPMCAGKACGADDGCGSACLVGTCPTAQKCNAGTCKGGTCVPDCAGKSCGDFDLCGGICTSGGCAAPGFTCNAGKCECKPVCTTCGGDDTCGGKCATGACDPGFKCSAGACAVDPASRWVLTFTNGSIPVDKSWDSLSLPDPMVCAWIGGSRVCTADAPNTLNPSWGCAFPAVSAAALMAGIDVETWDNDRSSSGTCGESVTAAPGDAICTRGPVSVGPDDLKAKKWSWGCAPLMTVNATLMPL